MKQNKYIFILGIVAVFVIIGVLGFFIGGKQPEGTQGLTPKTDVHTEPPPPSPNPTYLEKIKREPFWEKFPYFSEHYKIEYIDSNDLLIITTFLPASKTEAYKEEAVRWLRSNGAKIEALTVQYQRGVKDY